MKTITAAVIREPGGPFAFETLQLDEPRPDELLVRLTSSGLCHTDVSVQHGLIPTSFPTVLGHEGAGVVEAIGADVAGFAPGDRVALSFAFCGRCANCLTGRPAYCAQMLALNLTGTRADGSTTLTDTDGAAVHGSFFGQSSFATHTLVVARNAVKVPDGIDLDLTGPLGCGLQTGAGAIINTLAVGAGASVVITGTGSVGLAGIMAASAVGATTIVAVDVLAARLGLARELGATHTLNGHDEDAVEQIRRLTGGGAEYALDTTGVPGVIANGILALKMGGHIGLVAPARASDTLSMGGMTGKTLHFISEGDSVPQVFIPNLIALYQRGLFPIDRLVTKYPFEQLDKAIADTTSGTAVKAVLIMD